MQSSGTGAEWPVDSGEGSRREPGGVMDILPQPIQAWGGDSRPAEVNSSSS